MHAVSSGNAQMCICTKFLCGHLTEQEAMDFIEAMQWETSIKNSRHGTPEHL